MGDRPSFRQPSLCKMAPEMKALAMKAKAAAAMNKSGITAAIASGAGLKPADAKKALDSLVSVATKEMKSTGKFTLPGLCMMKVRVKPATKAGKRTMFGKVVAVKAKPAKKLVKVFAVSALKKVV